jgi:Mycothiol maleylpyruvate isomerase N-terminal domain
MQPLSPVYTSALFEPLHRELLAMLDRLDRRDWTRPTIAGSWQVRDVVAHLIEVDLRRLSVSRDGHQLEPVRAIESYGDLVAFLNHLNAEWVSAARRFSPQVLMELLRESGLAMAALVADLPPHASAAFAVAWAGEQRSENWFDIGRDYTERWHHQMQIRDAVGGPGLLHAPWLLPLLDLSVRCLPRAYADVDTHAGATVMLRVTTAAEADAEWTLQAVAAADDEPSNPARRSRWRLWRGGPPSPTATISLDADAAWRLFYNALPPESARQKAIVQGDARFAEPLFHARAVMV